ncbi:nucleoside/nucleotide kinase family protein [Arthrobacter monumenti]
MVSSEPIGVSFDELLSLARALAVPGTRRILGLVGAPGAGKSALAERLVAALEGLAICVPMDGFHLSNEILDILGSRERKGAIDTFDDGGYAALLERLHQQDASEGTIYAPEFRRDLEQSIGSALPIDPDIPLVITEGNYLLQDTGAWPRARACMDETWYLLADQTVRQERLIARHASYGRTAAEARTWALGSDEQNARLIETSASRADRVLRLV